MDLRNMLAPVKARYEELESLMSQTDIQPDSYTAMAREYAQLTPLIDSIQAWEKAEEAQVLAEDPEMKDMARDELARLDALIPELEHRIKKELLPKDHADDKSAILEIRAGTGGDEAALFAADLFNMYKNYAGQKGWRLNVLNCAHSDLEGFKEIIAEITGSGVFAYLKYESGVHRVQRVPQTESGGRIHTSAATVAVLPEAEEVDVAINDQDLRIDTFRSQGAGGQHVNTTDSAVRITHIPTGFAVSMQDEKSQHKNKDKAMRILRSRLYEIEREKLASERAEERKSQVGSGDRSERIRTYNFPQGRVTDHRINLTLYKLDSVLSGEALDEVIDPLFEEDQARKLAALESGS